MSRKKIIIVGGGDAYTKREDFMKSLQTREMWDLPTDSEQKNWKTSLVAALGDEYWVAIPNMPNKQNAKYDEWKIWFERHLEHIDSAVTLVGYSLGAMFLAKYLIEHEVKCKIKGLFLLAGPCGTFADESGNDCGSFQFAENQLGQLSAKVEKIVIMHSTDDFIVPYEHALRYQTQLPAAELVTFSDRNHFLVPELPELVLQIKAVA